MDALLTPSDIKRLAAARGLTMARVCAKAGVATSTFTRWQAGKTEPTLTIYRRFVAAVSDPDASDGAPGTPQSAPVEAA